jgi:hypothetical protein
MAKAGSLASFVALPAYEAQIQAVAQLHGQVGALVVQLREAHADADGAQSLLQHERRGAAALRGQLEGARGAYRELQADHDELREAHARLVAKDLMAAGLLKDRYVADLFGRLQRAEWALATARRRAAVWGFGLLVPEGRCDRGIQTQVADVWAAEQRQLAEEAKRLAAGAAATASPASSLPAIAPRGRASSAGAAIGGGASPRCLVPLASLSASTLAPCLSDIPGLGSGWGRAASPGGATSPVAEAAAGGSGHRVRPAFSDHAGGLVQTTLTMPKADAATGSKQLSSGAAAGATALLTAANWRSAVARRLLSGAPAPPPPVLSPRALLALVAEVLSAQAAVQGAVLRSGGSPSTSLNLPAFVFKHMSAPSHQQSRTATASGEGQEGGLLDSLTQLVASVRAHSATAKELSWFGQSLGCMGPLEEVAGQQQAAARRLGSETSSEGADGGDYHHGSTTGLPAIRSGVPTGVQQQQQAPRVRYEALPAAVLIPADVVAAIQRLASWPGVSTLLGWVAAGAFLAHIGGQEAILGRPLMDVQVCGHVPLHWVVFLGMSIGIPFTNQPFRSAFTCCVHTTRRPSSTCC